MKAATPFIVSLATLGLLTGCKSLPGDLQVEARSGAGLLVAPPHLTHTADGLWVSGYVARGAYYSGSSCLHLDIEVVSPDGRRLAFVPATYSPNPIPHRPRTLSSASYARRIQGSFPPGSRVYVTVHPTCVLECSATVAPAT